MSVIDAWAKGGLEVVDLPSGLRVRGKLPTVQDLVLNGVAPSELLARALPLFSRGVETFDEAEQRTWIAYQRVLAAAFVREAWNPETEKWEPALVTPEMLANGVPPDDVDALEDIILRRRTAGQVTALTRFSRGEIDADELRQVVATEAAGTVNAWSAFRPEPAGAPPGTDGADVADAPERPARAERRRRGARPRPDARAAAAG